MNDAPCKCKDCQERKIGCHATCTSYIKFKESIEETKNKKLEFFEKHGIPHDRYDY